MTVQAVMDDMETELADLGYDGMLLKYLGYVPDNVSAFDLRDVAEPFAEAMKEIREHGMVDEHGAISASFMHGFFVALIWRDKNCPHRQKLRDLGIEE